MIAAIARQVVFVVTMTFQLSEGVVCRQTGGELRMLFDRKKGVMYELNETASAVVGHLTANLTTEDQLVTALASEFSASEGKIREDVSRLLADFIDAGLLTTRE